MRKILLLLFLVLSSAVGEASECGCDPSADLSIRQFIDADLIFKGHVIAKRTEFFSELGYSFVATFSIDELISGNPESSTIDIEFGYGDDFCSINFQPLFSYLMVASKIDDFPYYQTHYCSGNRRWENLTKNDFLLLTDFRNGKNEMEWKDKFGRVYAKGGLSGRKPVGIWQFFDGQLKESGNFLEGKKEGEWFTFYYPLAICFELNLPIVNGLCDLSEVLPPHPAGWVSSVVPYRNGKIHGLVLTFKASGCIDSEAFYENGRMIGSATMY